MVTMKKGSDEALSDFTARFLDLATKIRAPSVTSGCQVGGDLITHALLAACENDSTLSADVRELRKEHAAGTRLTLDKVIQVFSLAHETRPQALPRALMARPRPKGGPKGGYCYAFQDGTCERTNCRFVHEVDPHWDANSHSGRASGSRGDRGADGGRGHGAGAGGGHGAARGAAVGRVCRICGGPPHPHKKCEKFQRWEQSGFPDISYDGDDARGKQHVGNLAVMPSGSQSVDFLYGFDHAALHRGTFAVDGSL
jgi:hypothetical protein